VKYGSVWTTYLLGPVYALLPRPWRALVYRGSQQLLARAAFISGILECLLSAFALAFWYLAFFDMLGDGSLRSVLPAVQASSFSWEIVAQASFSKFLLHPLTWLILCFGFEGMARALTALASNETMATFPLWALEKIYRVIKNSRRLSQIPLVPDEITGGGSFDLQIASCRPRRDWKYPFTIRYGGAYFQVIAEKFINAGPRPHIYSFQRLPAGEIASGLQEYDPKDVLTPVERIQPVG
jgi:hypothetical protein